MAVSPVKDTILSTINKRNTNIDYRLTLINPIATNNTIDSASFNSQMIGSVVNLNIKTIQQPLSTTHIPVSITSSYIIADVLDNNTLQISTPYVFKDQYGNMDVTNIIDANISISYLYVNYNDTPPTYQSNQSCADVTYENIRTFSGYVGRHKIYRRSLSSNGNFSIVTDEPIVARELLSDNISQNSFYNSMGIFYNNQHISRYWFTSSNNLSLTCSPNVAINSMYVSSPSFNTLSGNDYFMVKNDSVQTNKNATYVPFDTNQFSEESGSSYDSNFISLKSNVQYIVEVSTIILKSPSEVSASLSFYLTSSVQ